MEPDDSQRTRLRGDLAEARRLIGSGALDRARVLLDRVAGEAAAGLLGPATVLGLPRPLHSAYLKLAKAGGDRLRRIGYQHTLVPPPALLARHGVMSQDMRRRMAALGRAEVPRELHQVWIGPKPPPPTIAAWADHAGAHGFGHRLWREADLEREGILGDPVLAEMLDRGDYPGAVDVARYAILHRFGGIYLDCDWYPARRDIGFADRLALTGLTVIAEDIPRDTGAGSLLLSNAFIAAPPGHPAFARMIEAMPEVVRAIPGAPAWWSTGPLLFTVVCRAGPVTVADAGLVAGKAEGGTTEARIAAICRDNEAADGGLLLAWKPW